MTRAEPVDRDAASAGRPTRRRAAPEVRRLIVEAARQLFVARGYAKTRMKDVAERAGVTEQAIYRHFGSKSGLYEAVAIAPFRDFVDDYVASSALSYADDSAEEMARRFVHGFFGLLHEHRQALLTMIAGTVHEDPSFARMASETGARFAAAMVDMQDLLARQGEHRSYRGLNPAVTWPAVVAMMLAMVMHEDWLFPSGDSRPSPEAMEREAVAMILHGIGHRPAA